MKHLMHIWSHKKLFRTLLGIAFCFLFMVSCNPFYDTLEDEDYKYVYPMDKEVRFLENNTDTLVLNPGYNEYVIEGGSSFGIPGADYEIVISSLSINSKNNNISISKRAKSDILKFWVDCNNCTIRSRDYFEMLIDSLNNSRIIVLGKAYYDYYEIKADSTSEHLKVAYYNKEYGFLKVELQDGYLLELIPD